MRPLPLVKAKRVGKFMGAEALDMTQIIISDPDRTTSVTMPRVKDITVGAKEVANTVTMASGKVVKDVLGYRTTITAAWDYVPAATIVALLTLMRSSPFLFVEYPSPSGDASGTFEAEYPTLTVFCYKSGVAVWHDVTLTMSAQEVS